MNEKDTNSEELLKNVSPDLSYISGEKEIDDSTAFKGNIERFVGMAQVPIGLAGPILIHNGTSEYSCQVPLATTEGALVASYNRGMKATFLSGGVTTICIQNTVHRSPFFKFGNLIEAELFSQWIDDNHEVLAGRVCDASRYAKLQSIKTDVEGNTVIVTFSFDTGDAAGQNMVTICTEHLCQYIINTCTVSPELWYVESNYSGDKKATSASFINGRGRKVSAEVTIPKGIVKKVLKSSPEDMATYWKYSTLATVKSGAIGAQGHVANGLAALFIACGQDVACVSESSVGVTRMELTGDGDLYASLTLPTLVVGTVGGGTGLPTQKECLGILDCIGENKSNRLAEICCATALAGEISIAAALSAHHFTSAHEKLGRKK